MRKSMRITVINPNTTKEMTDDIRKAAALAAAPDTIITAASPAAGPASIEGYSDHYIANIGVMSVVKEISESGRADGFVVACYGDPGVPAARELTALPVVGIAEASMYMACMVAAKFSIISILDRCNYILEEMLYSYGMERRCASIRSTGLTVLEAKTDPVRTMDLLEEHSERAVKEDGAEAILLGCAGMVSFTEKLEQKLGVPVFDGVIAAVKMVEGLVYLKKKTSKKCTYAYPEPKAYTGFENMIVL
jgi:allantoin racemase